MAVESSHAAEVGGAAAGRPLPEEGKGGEGKPPPALSSVLLRGRAPGAAAGLGRGGAAGREGAAAVAAGSAGSRRPLRGAARPALYSGTRGHPAPAFLSGELPIFLFLKYPK